MDFEQKNRVALINLGIVILLFIVGMLLGGGREGLGPPIYVLGYLVLFLVNLVICIRAFSSKDRSKGKLYLILTIALLVLALPFLMLFIMCTGGMC